MIFAGEKTYSIPLTNYKYRCFVCHFGSLRAKSAILAVSLLVWGQPTLNRNTLANPHDDTPHPEQPQIQSGNPFDCGGWYPSTCSILSSFGTRCTITPSLSNLQIISETLMVFSFCFCSLLGTFPHFNRNTLVQIERTISNRIVNREQRTILGHILHVHNFTREQFARTVFYKSVISGCNFHFHLLRFLFNHSTD